MAQVGAVLDPVLRQKIDQRREVLHGINEERIERLELDFQPEDIDDDAYLSGGGLQLDAIDSMGIIVGMQSRFGGRRRLRRRRGPRTSPRNWHSPAEPPDATCAGRRR